MALEIERKFLVADNSWRSFVTAKAEITQGYLFTESNCTLRVRLKGDQAFLTVKLGSGAIHRSEFEYGIPVDDAKALLADVPEAQLIRKTRHLVSPDGELVWEIDVFSGFLEGLVVAEVELPRADRELTVPGWAGPEVTFDPRFLNQNLQRLDADSLGNLLAQVLAADGAAALNDLQK